MSKKVTAGDCIRMVLLNHAQHVMARLDDDIRNHERIVARMGRRGHKQ